MANKILLYMNMVMLLNEEKNEDSFNTRTFETTAHQKALKVPTKNNRISKNINII
jgi:hypothetical protein